MGLFKSTTHNYAVTFVDNAVLMVVAAMDVAFVVDLAWVVAIVVFSVVGVFCSVVVVDILVIGGGGALVVGSGTIPIA